MTIRICYSYAAATSIDNIVVSITNCFKCGAGGLIDFQTMLTCASVCFNHFLQLPHILSILEVSSQRKSKKKMKMR